MEEDKIIITEVKFFKDLIEGKKKDEPDWNKLGLPNPQFSEEEEQEFEYVWIRRTFPARTVLGVTELDKETTIIELFDREIIINMGYEQAVKEIYNKEVKTKIKEK